MLSAECLFSAECILSAKCLLSAECAKQNCAERLVQQIYRVSNKKIPHLKLSNNFANFTHIKMKISAFIDNIFLHIRGKFHCKR